jgi:hypothetical protein
MNSYLSHLYLIPSNDEHVTRWFDGFGKASDNYYILEVDTILSKTGYSGLNKSIESIVIEHNVSVIILDTSTPIVNPFFILYLKKKYNLMFLTLNIDDEFKFEWISAIYSTIADLVLSFDYVSIERFRQSGINAHWLMHPIYIPSEKGNEFSLNKKYDVSFVGRADKGKPSRFNLLTYLADQGIRLSIFSSMNSNDPNYLTMDDMYSVYHNSRINLSFSGITTYGKTTNVLFPSIRGFKGRPFEIASAGGFCLCEYAISIAKVFEDGKDIVFFYSKSDLFEKINYYLAHPDQVNKISMAASKKVHEEFSSIAIANKLKKLIEQNKKNIGKNLYGESQKLVISNWFAYSHLEFVLPYIIRNLLKGKLLLFFKDSKLILNFCKKIYFNIGLADTLKVVIITIIRLIKTLLVKLKFW